MTAYDNLRLESARYIYSVLISALNGARHGDFDLVQNIGISIQTLRDLDSLKPDQISHVASNYLLGCHPLSWLPLNPAKLTKLIEQERSESHLHELTDEFLERGACNLMMNELFGWRSTQVAARKKYLGIQTSRGRLRTLTLTQQKAIYGEWLSNIEVADVRERLLIVARRTDLFLSHIYREVQIIEQVANQKPQTQTTKLVCA